MPLNIDGLLMVVWAEERNICVIFRYQTAR